MLSGISIAHNFISQFWGLLTERDAFFNQYMANMGLTQIVNFATRGLSYFSMVFYSDPIRKCHLTSIELISSDEPPHIPISFSMGCEEITITSKPIFNRLREGKLVLRRVDWSMFYMGDPLVGKLWNYFHRVVHKMTQLSVPITQKRGRAN